MPADPNEVYTIVRAAFLRKFGKSCDLMFKFPENGSEIQVEHRSSKLTILVPIISDEMQVSRLADNLYGQVNKPIEIDSLGYC